jgi:hypothetical protein
MSGSNRQQEVRIATMRADEGDDAQTDPCPRPTQEPGAAEPPSANMTRDARQDSEWSDYRGWLKKKRVRQQAYRDARRGIPDARRIAVVALELMLEADAIRPGKLDRVFEKIVERLAFRYDRSQTRSAIKKLRERALDHHEEAELRRRRAASKPD